MKPSQPHRQRDKDLLPSLLVVLAFFLICALWDRILLPGTRDLWDARVYAVAIAAWRHGLDPYSLASGGLPFVYPPVFLVVTGLLAHFVSGRAAWLLYLLLLAACTIAVPIILSTWYLRSKWLTPLTALLLFALQPRLIGEMVFLSANLGVILYALILIAGIPGIRNSRWLWFYLAVVAAALVKPPYLALLILPLLAGSRQIWQTCVTAAATALLFVLQWIAMPAQYAAFQRSVVFQVMVRRDAGFGLLFYWLKISSHLPSASSVPMVSASVALVLFIALLACALLYLRPRSAHPAVQALWLPLLLVVAILSNPRLQDYDADIALLPGIFLAIQSIKLIPPSRLRIPALTAFFAGLAALLSKDSNAAILFFLITSVVLAVWRILAEPIMPSPGTNAIPHAANSQGENSQTTP